MAVETENQRFYKEHFKLVAAAGTGPSDSNQNGQIFTDFIKRTDQPTASPSRPTELSSFPKGLQRQTQMALVNGRSKLAKILAEEGRWRRSPATAHQDSLAETGKLRTLREGTESIVFVQYGAQGPRPTITMLTGRSGAATTS